MYVVLSRYDSTRTISLFLKLKNKSWDGFLMQRVRNTPGMVHTGQLARRCLKLVWTSIWTTGHERAMVPIID